MKKAVFNIFLFQKRKYTFLWLCAFFALTFQVSAQEILPGAHQYEEYLPLLKNKKVGIVAHHASFINDVHLVDFLLSKKVSIAKVFAPEHGFRGDADAGEKVKDGVDPKTKLPIISLYGSNKKPSAESLKDIDIMVFDLQDVGVRFYTYISTLHYVMEACAENKIPLLILDRPNPNRHYIDGPVLDTNFTSFIGMHAVPVVYGMTIGEYGQMINGEKWLANNIQCDLKIIPCKNYTIQSYYQLPIAPSPNLPNMSSIYLYPSLCFFEGTAISVGRGTDKPFQIIGHPDLKTQNYEFTPESKPGAKNPKLKGKLCHGYDLKTFGEKYMKSWGKLYLFWLKELHDEMGTKAFFTRPDFFDLLAGSDTLRQQISDGKTIEAISESWQEDLKAFKEIRVKYLMY